jgi:hypothetical protein
MKRTLRKKAGKKAETRKKTARTIKHKHTEVEIFLLFAAVLALFFAVLSSQVLVLFLNYDVSAQKKIDAVNNSLNNVELRLNNESVLNQLNSMNKQNTTNH